VSRKFSLKYWEQISIYRASHFTVASISNGLSDHDAQYIVLEKGFSYQTALPFHKKQVINKETINSFIETKEQHEEKFIRLITLMIFLMYF
jgi:hypothetical protein